MTTAEFNKGRYFHILAKAIPGKWVMKGDLVEGRNYVTELTSNEVDRIDCVGMGVKYWHNDRDVYFGKVVQQIISADKDIIVVLELPPAPDPESRDGKIFDVIRSEIIDSIINGANKHVSVTVTPTHEVDGPNTITFNRNLSEISIVSDPRRDGADIMAFRWDDLPISNSSTPPLRQIRTNIDVTFDVAGDDNNKYIIQTFTTPKSAADININTPHKNAVDNNNNINPDMMCIDNDSSTDIHHNMSTPVAPVIPASAAPASAAPAKAWDPASTDALFAKMTQQQQELDKFKALAEQKAAVDKMLAEKQQELEAAQKRISVLAPQAQQSIQMQQQIIEENEKAFIANINKQVEGHARTIAQLNDESPEAKAEAKALSDTRDRLAGIAKEYFSDVKERSAATANGLAHDPKNRDREAIINALIQETDFLNVIAHKNQDRLIEANRRLLEQRTLNKGEELLQQHLKTQQQPTPTLTPIHSLSGLHAAKLAQYSSTTSSSLSAPAPLSLNTQALTIDQLRARGIFPQNYGATTTNRTMS